RRGYVPVPLIEGKKRPGVSGWTSLSFSSEDDVKARFTTWADQGMTNVGVLLGESSGGLVDVDIDHPKASRVRDIFLPPTAARSGRGSRRSSHYWYICDTKLPGSTRQHLMPKSDDGSKGPVSVELRSTGAQTVIPPSTHPSGEDYLWEGEPWGGDQGPTVIDGKQLAARVAMLGLAAVLIDNRP